MSDNNNKEKDLTEQVEDSKISFENLSKKAPSSKFDKIVTLILLVICIALALFVIFGTVSGGEVAAVEQTTVTAINVQTETASPGLFQSYTRLNGEIGSDASDIAITPDTSGTITSILVKRGDIVTEGQIIAYIDPSKPGLSYKESPVTSPISGMITSIPVSVGETVSSSSSIATISGDKTLYIEASLPERYLGTVELGMTANFTSVAYSGESFTGVLTYISPNVSTSTRTSDVEIAITSGSDRLREGMYVTIDLVTEEQENVITVPSSSITEILDQDYVYVVEDGKASLRGITTGSSNETRTIVTSGLYDGDIVITAGTVADGSTVNVLE